MDRKKERGHVAVEAVIILPIAVLSTHYRIAEERSADSCRIQIIK